MSYSNFYDRYTSQRATPNETHTHTHHPPEIRRETEKRAESVEYQMYY